MIGLGVVFLTVLTLCLGRSLTLILLIIVGAVVSGSLPFLLGVLAGFFAKKFPVLAGSIAAIAFLLLTIIAVSANLWVPHSERILHSFSIGWDLQSILGLILSLVWYGAWGAIGGEIAGKLRRKWSSKGTLNKWRYVRVFLLLILLGVAALTLHLFLRLWNESKRAACGSYLASMASFLWDNQQGNSIREITQNLGKEWRFLNDQEYNTLANTLSRESYSLDLGGVSPAPDKILFDHWNQRILIAGRKLPGKDPEFILWSKGPDRVFRTEDDISAPWNEPVPDGLKE